MCCINCDNVVSDSLFIYALRSLRAFNCSSLRFAAADWVAGSRTTWYLMLLCFTYVLMGRRGDSLPATGANRGRLITFRDIKMYTLLQTIVCAQNPVELSNLDIRSRSTPGFLQAFSSFIALLLFSLYSEITSEAVTLRQVSWAVSSTWHPLAFFADKCPADNVESASFTPVCICSVHSTLGQIISVP